jgi:hypothetical protein
LPFEVLKASFLFLVKEFGSDLASPSLTCRAFRAVALELMNSRVMLAEKGRIERFIYGHHLRSLVGLEMCTIKHLIIDLKNVGKEFIRVIARNVAHTLSILVISGAGVDSSECYEALGVLFEQCGGILALRLWNFDFGDIPDAISQVVKDGVVRLSQLDLTDCRGNIRMFVENTPIPHLGTLAYQSARVAGEEEEILDAIASN